MRRSRRQRLLARAARDYRGFELSKKKLRNRQICNRAEALLGVREAAPAPTVLETITSRLQASMQQALQPFVGRVADPRAIQDQVTRHLQTLGVVLTQLPTVTMIGDHAEVHISLAEVPQVYAGNIEFGVGDLEEKRQP